MSVIDAPIDYFILTNNMNNQRNRRGTRLDCRQFFSCCFLFVSVAAFLSVLALKIALHLSGQDDNAFDNETTTNSGEEGSDALSVLVSEYFVLSSDQILISLMLNRSA